MTSPAGGYFSAPKPSLDPALFEPSTRLRRDVRLALAALVKAAMTDLQFAAYSRWLNVWLAGSGISYQWGNGDLDILVGVDYYRFTVCNPEYQGVNEDAVADVANKWLKRHVWPKSKHTVFNGSEYETTIFWAPGIGRDIGLIHPYAAYDVMKDRWVIKPPETVHGPVELYAESWERTARSDRAMATQLHKRYSSASRKLSRLTDPALQANANTEISLIHAQARALYDDIHAGRRRAFEEQGHGYLDFHNFRWQRAKFLGTIRDLQRLTDRARLSDSERDEELYGGPITDAQEALRRAELWKSGRINGL